MSYELPSPSSNHAPDSLPVPTPRTIDLEPGLSSPEARLDPRLTDLADTAVAAATITERASLPLPTDSQPAPNLHEVPQPVDVQAPPTPAATDLAPVDGFSLQPAPIAPPVVRHEAEPQEAARPMTPDAHSGSLPTPVSSNQSPDGPPPVPALHATDSEHWLAVQPATDSHTTDFTEATVHVRASLSMTDETQTARSSELQQPDEQKVPAPDRPSPDTKSEVATPPPSKDDKPVDQPVLQTGGAGHGNKDSDPSGLRSGDGEEQPEESGSNFEANRQAYEQRMDELKQKEVAERAREVGNCLGVLGEIAYGPHGKDIKLGEDWLLRGQVREYVNYHNSLHPDKQIEIGEDLVVGRRADIPIAINGQSAHIEVVVYDERLEPLLRNVDDALHRITLQERGEVFREPPEDHSSSYTSLGDFRITIENSETDPVVETLGVQGWILRNYSLVLSHTIYSAEGQHAEQIRSILDELGLESVLIPTPEEDMHHDREKIIDSEASAAIHNFLKNRVLPAISPK
jgi:hypothetical protein